jgi:hypothetical protein
MSVAEIAIKGVTASVAKWACMPSDSFKGLLH